MDITIEHGDTLRFGPQVRIQFLRTLRIPDDGRSYPLPPGLGRFPLRMVDDYAGRVPAEWAKRGGVLLPMYQREAMWLRFQAPGYKPRAIKVGVGKVCAITGAPWSEELHGRGSAYRGSRKQDYVVAPTQPWLDGIYAGEGTIRQFVAMPLGMGYTVEGQVTGAERFGGIQLKVFEPKPGRFPDQPPPVMRSAPMPCAPACAPAAPAGGMGLAAGGRMKQKIYPDRHGVETWDPENTGRLFVHLVNSQQWREITGEEPPPTPVTAKAYARHGYPWFDLYDEHLPTLPKSATLADVKSVKEMDQQKHGAVLQDDSPVATPFVTKLWKSLVRDGEW